jgi:hypothetical protein
MTLKEKKIYKRIKKIILKKNEYEWYDDQKRYCLDLEDSQLWYFHKSGKIIDSKLGVVFKRSGKWQCWFNQSELSELIKQVETVK